MEKSRWLAIYIGASGKLHAAMIVPKEHGDFPFGVDETALGLDYYDGEPVTFIQMPADPDYRPMIVDNEGDDEIPLQFIDL